MTYVLYFSPTGGTKRVAERLAEAFCGAELVDMTVCLPPLNLQEDDLCLAAVPSFGGRVPNAALQHLHALHGNGAKAVAVAVYGNRHYDDTLLELQRALEERDCVIIAGIAAIAEHSVVRQFAAGRPDEADAAQLREFAAAIQDKLQQGGGAVTLPGNVPYKEFGGAPFRPVVTEDCAGCGLCARECPVGATPLDAPNTTDNERCFACLRCISVCPSKARVLPKAVVETMTEKLRPACEIPKENQLFL